MREPAGQGCFGSAWPACDAWHISPFKIVKIDGSLIDLIYSKYIINWVIIISIIDIDSITVDFSFTSCIQNP